jgi:hypothetical protein
MPAMHTLRARIEFRNIKKREPAAAEVEEYSRLHFEDQMTFKQISAAFQSGDEVHRHLLFFHNAIIDGSAILSENDCRRYLLYGI